MQLPALAVQPVDTGNALLKAAQLENFSHAREDRQVRNKLLLGQMDAQKRALAAKQAPVIARYLGGVQSEEEWNAGVQTLQGLGIDMSGAPRWSPNAPMMVKRLADSLVSPKDRYTNAGDQIIDLHGDNGPSVALDARKPIPLAPGGTLVSPSTSAPLFTAPEKEDRTLVEVVDPNNPRRTIMVPRAQAQGMPGAKSVESAGKDFKTAADLRGEFTKSAKDFVQVRDAQARIEASAKDPSAAGDLALIFGFMKVMDPGSTVREGEFATAQNAAGVDERLRAVWNKVLTGERLTEAQRNDFVTRARALYARQEQTHRKTVDEYTRLAKSFEIAPEDVIVDMLPASPFGTPSPAPAASAAPAPQVGAKVSGSALSALPDGTVVTGDDGRDYVVRNGQPILAAP